MKIRGVRTSIIQNLARMGTNLRIQDVVDEFVEFEINPAAVASIEPIDVCAFVAHSKESQFSVLVMTNGISYVINKDTKILE